MTGRGLISKCFISYHRPDNDDYTQVVDRLKKEITARFASETGRDLEIFLDRDSIGWGENWRTKIRDSVLDATLFIPVVTMRYFRSDPCREELTAFHENAQRLGVTELILPIVLAGASRITADSPDDQIRLIESLNYKRIDSAWRAGYESTEWLTLIDDMVKAFESAIDRAEQALADREQAVEIRDAAGGKPVDADSEAGAEVNADAEADAADLVALTEDMEGMKQDMESALATMNTFGEAVRDLMAEMPGGASASQKQSVLIRRSKRLADVGDRFAEASSAFERRATRVDAQLRAVFAELRDIGIPQAVDGLETITTAIAGMPDLEAQLATLDEAVGGMRLAAMSNISVRRALQPSLRGMQSMRTALSTVRSWASL